MPTNTPAPGWYTDQTNSAQLRWWDGQAWTEHSKPLSPSGIEQSTVVPSAWSSPSVQSAATKAAEKKPWYFRWWAITTAVLIALTIVGSLLPNEETPGAEATATKPSASGAESPSASPEPEAEPEPEPEPEPVDTDGDGVNDEEDYLPKDAKVQTENDVDTDKDGVADFKDAFPKDSKYSKDTDGDRVADPIDDFPKDERYSKDSDGDNVADSEDVFPADPSRSKITPAMENAIGAAESYLDYTAFSRSGLIEQLEFEDYGTADATFAVDYLQVDWNEQAVESAKSYLDYTSFSLQGLIEQLQFEGFTYEQAAYGANKAY